MSKEIERLEGESIVAELVEPGAYMSHRNQVASVTDQRLILVKKNKEMPYYRFEDLPISECSRISYKKTFAIGAMLGGMILLLTGLLVLIFSITGQLGKISAVIYGIPIGVIGAFLVFGVKRHKLLFHCREKNLPWISGAGEFKKSLANLGKLRDFAFKKGMVVNDFNL